MKRFALALALLAVCFLPVRGAGRVNQSLTITAGTPVRVAEAGTIADEIIITPVPGGTVGLVYVMAGIYNRTPAKTTAADLTTILCPATATLPGCIYSDGTLVQASTGVDVGAVYIDVGTSNTVVLVSYVPR